ncbi:MAG: hypothetical protein ACLRFE_00695 [Clostridia bacterium]
MRTSKKRPVLIVCSFLCLILMGVVVAIAFTYKPPKHQHVLGEDRVYHITTNTIHYTRTCQDGCQVPFKTRATFTDVLMSLTPNDKVVLDEDVYLKETVFIKTFSGAGEDVQTLDIDIDLDLNNHTLTANNLSSEHNSIFMFNSNLGSVNLNVKNGKIVANGLSHIFRFKNTRDSGENIILNIDNVECVSNAIKSAPLYVHEVYNAEINAVDSKFISTNTSNNDCDYGVGVFVNNNNLCDFNNCYFEGGDAVHVKSGTVNLTDCHLVNSGLVSNPGQSVKDFSAVGACLTVNSHTTSGGTTEFNITIKRCFMEALNSVKMIYEVQTAEESKAVSQNENSIVDVQSCTFNQDPTAIVNSNLIKYPNNQAPQNNGTQIWSCGEAVETVAE